MLIKLILITSWPPNRWALTWNHCPYFITNNNFYFRSPVTALSTSTIFSTILLATMTPTPFSLLPSPLQSISYLLPIILAPFPLHLTFFKQQMSMQRLFNCQCHVSVISPDFPHIVPTLHEENQRRICASGVFTPIQAQLPSDPPRDTDAFFLTRQAPEISARYLGVYHPMQKGNHHKSKKTGLNSTAGYPS